jgi:hypothetical protein
MFFNFVPLLTGLGLFLGMLLGMEAGRRLATRRAALLGPASLAGFGAVEGAIFALMGLLVAFTFSGAAARLDTRRTQIVDESNAIGTAWLRLDLLPAEAQPPLRDLFRRYADARIEAYRRMPDMEAARVEMKRAQDLQTAIWAAAVAASRGQPPSTALLLLPALNQMIDITTTRTMAMRMHPPAVIYVMLAAVAVAGALLAGYAMAAGGRSWLHTVAFVTVMAITVWVILDLEFPRAGFIRLDSFDQVLVDVRRSMGN